MSFHPYLAFSKTTLQAMTHYHEVSGNVDEATDNDPEGGA